ncbi:hypothetical protein [Rhodococcoides yunnanense]|uniref:hypothetical protein n=1 Tax=Rhodococcoides yunnanense TaxID=278209 RepID=UPI000AC860E2|nr:hypothetical protein [Rhodococcus yunnanensis]
MARPRVHCSSALALFAVLLAGCGGPDDGRSTAPLATVDTDPPSIVRTSTQSATAAPSTTSSQPSRTPPSSALPSSIQPSSSPTTTSAPPTADASAFEADRGYFYFTSPSGKFECGIVVTDSSVAGCHGDFPSSAPKVEGSGAPESTVAPNTVELTAGSPARFLSSGDPRFHRFGGTAPELAYGETLSIPGSGSSNGLSCRVEESTGVTCLDQVGHGFTVSDSAFELK